MVSVIIVAAGRGTRMGPKIDKIFFEVAGRPVIAHTWQLFVDMVEVEEIVLVVRDGMQSAFNEIAAQFGFNKKPFRLVVGGAERQDSVWNGLESLSAATDIVAIQDGARPCTDLALIRAILVAARETGAAVAAHPVTDTIKESTDGSVIARTLDRSKLWAVQTPQAFKVDIIKRALTAVRQTGKQVTDDTAACELIGQPVRLITGDAPNPKVTVPADLAYIELLLKG